jgi:hypothetical protein
VLAVVLMPFPVFFTNLSEARGGYDFQAPVFFSDLCLAVLIIAVAPRLLQRLRARTLGVGAVCWLIVTVLMTVAFVAHPAVRGGLAVFRLFGTLALIVVVSDVVATVERKILLVTVAATAGLQTLIAVLQLARHRPVGLERLGEFPDPFFRYGSALLPQGTMVHPYVLAGFALVTAFILIPVAMRAARPIPWLAAVAVVIAPIGFTYSRAAAIGLAAAGACVAVGLLGRERRRTAAALVALAVGFGVPALVWSDGWRQRASQTTGATSANQLSTNRTYLFKQADGLIVDHPVLGVGTGRYVIALKNKIHVDPKGVFKPVHNVPLLIAAEGGIPAGLAFTALLVLLGWQAFRTGRLTLALYVVYMPFVLLDHFPYTFAQGLVTTGLWIGVLDWYGRRQDLRQLP